MQLAKKNGQKLLQIGQTQKLSVFLVSSLYHCLIRKHSMMGQFKLCMLMKNQKNNSFLVIVKNAFIFNSFLVNVETSINHKLLIKIYHFVAQPYIWYPTSFSRPPIEKENVGVKLTTVTSENRWDEVIDSAIARFRWQFPTNFGQNCNYRK